MCQDCLGAAEEEPTQPHHFSFYVKISVQKTGKLSLNKKKEEEEALEVFFPTVSKSS